MIRSIVSMSDSIYQIWQMEVLAESFRRAQQPGILTRLVSTSNPDSIGPIDNVETILTRAYSPDPITGDDYLPYNKPASLLEWLDANPNDNDETLLLFDPDFVFLSPFVREPECGRPLAEPIWYMETHWPDSQVVLKRHCRVPFDRVQPTGVPTFIRRSDVRLIAPRWYELTRQMREDPETKLKIGWVCEMWGYSIAAAEAGLVHDFEKMAHFQMHEQATLSLIHYCYHSESKDGAWIWNKRTYQPWTKPVPCPSDTTEVVQRLHEIVEATAAKFNYLLLSGQ